MTVKTKGEIILEAAKIRWKERFQTAATPMLEKLFATLIEQFKPYTDMGSEMYEGKEVPLRFIPEHQEQVANAIVRVAAYAIQMSIQNPPTHRAGEGDAGEIIIQNPPPLVWEFDGPGPDGSELPMPGKPQGEPGEPDDDSSNDMDWAPGSEVGRAQAMMQQVASEWHFGYGDDPLKFIREVARRLGGRWGLNGKRGNPNDPSRDVLAWRMSNGVPQTFDVLIDAGGKNGITWQNLPYTGNNAVWIAP